MSGAGSAPACAGGEHELRYQKIAEKYEKIAVDKPL